MSEEKVTLSDGKEAARQRILDLVAEYCDKYHNQKKEFTEGQRIPYASRVYDNHEMVNHGRQCAGVTADLRTLHRSV